MKCYAFFLSFAISDDASHFDAPLGGEMREEIKLLVIVAVAFIMVLLSHP